MTPIPRMKECEDQMMTINGPCNVLVLFCQKQVFRQNALFIPPSLFLSLLSLFALYTLISVSPCLGMNRIMYMEKKPVATSLLIVLNRCKADLYLALYPKT